MVGISIPTLYHKQERQEIHRPSSVLKLMLLFMMSLDKERYEFH
jgi:hypothetical protein